MNIIFYIITLLLLATQAFAENAHPANATRLYEVHWGGLHIADLAGEISKNHFAVDIKSYGMVKKISKYKSHSELDFSFENGKYVPKKFFTTSRQRHGKRDIKISYNDNAAIKKEQVTPPDKRFKRPAVADNMKKFVVDPLTAALISRIKIKQALESGKSNFSFNIYDARRLSRLEFQVEGKTTIKLHGKKTPAIKMSFRRAPIAGHTQNELKRQKGEEPDFTVFLSDDEAMLPIKAYATAPLGKAIITMKRDCESISECF